MSFLPSFIGREVHELRNTRRNSSLGDTYKLTTAFAQHGNARGRKQERVIQYLAASLLMIQGLISGFTW